MSCLLCPLPTGSPMTPASWSVRRMLFGYSSHSRWLSCARRWFAEYPHLYALHPTPYTGVPTICHVRGGGSPCLPCFRVNPCSSVGGTSPCHLLCFASGLAIFSPLSFRSRGCLVLADFPASGASIKDLGKKWFAFNRMEMSSSELLQRI